MRARGTSLLRGDSRAGDGSGRTSQALACCKVPDRRSPDPAQGAYLHELC